MPQALDELTLKSQILEQKQHLTLTVSQIHVVEAQPFQS